MAISNVLRKMFSGGRESNERYDEYGEPIPKLTLDERRLRRIQRKRYLQAVRKKVDSEEKREWKEMTSHEMPYHKRFKRFNRR